jgi:hypothetical protein
MARKKTSAIKPSKKPVKTAKKVSLKKPNLKGIAGVFKSPTWKPVLKVVGLTLIILGAFIGVDLFIQYLNNDYSVAVVNGERIPRSDYYKLLDQSYGESISETLIEYSLIRQEAQKQGIELTDDEINKELQNTIDYVGGQEAYDSLLVSNGITNNDVIDQIELSLLTTKILTPTLDYTDDDVKEFFDEYSDLIFPDETDALEEGELLNYDDYKEETEEVYINQLIEEGKDTWLEGLKEEAKIQNNATEKPSYGILTVTRNIINNLIDSVNTTTEE